MKTPYDRKTTYRLKALLALSVASGPLYLPITAQAQEETPIALHTQHKHGETLLTKLMLDRFEWRDSKPDRTVYWDAQAWFGDDINKLWLKTEGEARRSKVREADIAAFYSRAIAPYWDVQAGVRHDLQVNGLPSRNWLALGMKGLAPYKFDIDATAYVGDTGRSAARLKAEYNLLITQRLVLMPEFEANVYGKKDPERELGSGLANVDLSLRLRYDIRRTFSPYIGVVWTHLYGDTADYARQNGGEVHTAEFVAGVRTWW